MPGPKRRDLTGQVFGRLAVLAEEQASPDGHTRWLCQCECGGRVIARATHLRGGVTVSCGCAGYRRDPEAHKKARMKVKARRRRAIAASGAAARWPRGEAK